VLYHGHTGGEVPHLARVGAVVAESVESGSDEKQAA
jgi:hypothetical protein